MATIPERLLEYVLKNSTKGDCTSVLDAIDKFSWNVEWTMSIGDVKGLILDEAFKKAKPTTVLELGAYCGYSALRMARLLKEGGKIYSVEPNEETIKVTRKVFEQAGMCDQIEIIVGSSSDVIPKLSTTHNIKSVDFVLFDHWKDLYYPDFQALEKIGLLHAGSVIVADNTGARGTTTYVDYVVACDKYETINHDSKMEYSDRPDGIAVSIVK